MTRVSPIRRESGLRRKAGRRPPRTTTLVVCEGETEVRYLEALRRKLNLLPAEVVLADNTDGSAPISVVHCAERLARNGPFDRIFCVFDRDNHESYQRARERIELLASRRSRPLPISEIVSVPCFEIWVLLHFEQTDAQFRDCAAVVRRIRDRHMPEYEKASGSAAVHLMERTDEALAAADWLARRAEANARDPYTDVHRLVAHMKAVSESMG